MNQSYDWFFFCNKVPIKKGWCFYMIKVIKEEIDELEDKVDKLQEIVDTFKELWRELLMFLQNKFFSND